MVPPPANHHFLGANLDGAKPAEVDRDQPPRGIFFRLPARLTFMGIYPTAPLHNQPLGIGQKSKGKEVKVNAQKEVDVNVDRAAPNLEFPRPFFKTALNFFPD